MGSVGTQEGVVATGSRDVGFAVDSDGGGHIVADSWNCRD